MLASALHWSRRRRPRRGAERPRRNRRLAEAPITPPRSAIWRPLAERGDADARSTSARPIASAAACRPTSPAPRTGSSARRAKSHVDAETTLGLLLFQNGDQRQGLKWLKLRRSKASRGLCWSTAPRCSTATGSRRTRCSATRIVSRAAAQGLAPAKETLAQMDLIMPVDQRRKGVALRRRRQRPRRARRPAPSRANGAGQARRSSPPPR